VPVVDDRVVENEEITQPCGAVLVNGCASPGEPSRAQPGPTTELPLGVRNVVVPLRKR